MESRLVAVNQSSVLRRPWVASSSQVGKGARHEQTEERVKKNQHEKAKRDGERLHLERMSHLFRVSNPQQTWTRVDVLCFGKMVFSSAGSNDCSPDSFQPPCSSFTVPVPSRRVLYMSCLLNKDCKHMIDQNGLNFPSYNSFR